MLLFSFKTPGSWTIDLNPDIFVETISGNESTASKTMRDNKLPFNNEYLTCLIFSDKTFLLMIL